MRLVKRLVKPLVKRLVKRTWHKYRDKFNKGKVLGSSVAAARVAVVARQVVQAVPTQAGG